VKIERLRYTRSHKIPKKEICLLIIWPALLNS